MILIEKDEGDNDALYLKKTKQKKTSVMASLVQVMQW